MQRRVASVVRDDGDSVQGLGCLQESSENANVAAGRRQVQWRAAPTVPDQQSGTMLQQSLHTRLVPRHRLCTHTNKQTNKTSHIDIL